MKWKVPAIILGVGSVAAIAAYFVLRKKSSSLPPGDFIPFVPAYAPGTDLALPNLAPPGGLSQPSGVFAQPGQTAASSKTEVLQNLASDLDSMTAIPHSNVIPHTDVISVMPKTEPTTVSVAPKIMNAKVARILTSAAVPQTTDAGKGLVSSLFAQSGVRMPFAPK